MENPHCVAVGGGQAAIDVSEPADVWGRERKRLRRGGCAFRGARLGLQPIVDVAHLVHGPITCQGHSWDSRPTGSSGARLHRSTFITDIGEMDLIYGGAEKLGRAIREIAARRDPAAIFVYQTCLPAMIGDDIAAVCRAGTKACGRPVIPVDAPGFAGDMVFGIGYAGKVLLDQVIGSREPALRTNTDINIIGENNVAGELRQIEPLLAELGIRVLASIPGDGRYDDIACAHRARAAISLCSRSLCDLAEAMREKYGIAYVEGSFYGISSTSRTLRAIAGLLARRGGPADLPARTEALISREEARAWAQLAQCRERLAKRRALLLTGGVKSWSLAAALGEVGLPVVGSSMNKSTCRDRQKALAVLHSDDHLCEGLTSRDLYALLRDGKIDVVLGGGASRFVAARARTAWVEVNHQRAHPVTGYSGMVLLARDIDMACASPILRQARRPAPWERDAGARREPPWRG